MTRLLRLAVATMLALALSHSAFAQVWMPVGGLADARTQHVLTTLQDGRVLVAGGIGAASEGLNSAELYDPATHAWAPAAPMQAARCAFPAVRLLDGRVLVSGGRCGAGGGRSTNSAEIYDPATGNWTLTPSMHRDRTGHTATLLQDGRVLVVGGYSDNSGFLSAAEIYDPAANTWTVTASLMTGRWLQTATLLNDGRVLVAAGENYAFCNASCMLASAELFSPATGTWSGTGFLHEDRANHGATLLPDGRVLVAGGLSYSNFIAPSGRTSTEIFNPGTGLWSLTGSLAVGRDTFVSAFLPGGQFLVGGGRTFAGGPVILSSAEQYDPASGTWSAAASLTQARNNSAGALLADGTVLVAGGQNGSGAALTGSEVYGFVAPPPNTAPAVQLFGGPFSTNESQFQNLNVGGNFSDPDSQQWSATVDYGDGTGVQGLSLSNLQPGTGNGPTGQFNLVHTYTNNGTYTVTVVVDDHAGGLGSATTQVSVQNVSPQVFGPNGGSVAAGAAYAPCFSFFDPGTDAPWSATVDFGDGTPVESLSFETMQLPGSCGGGTTTGAFTVRHVFASATFGQNPSVRTGTVTVTDKDGGVGTRNFSVTVLRVSPTVTLMSSGSPSNVGQAVTFTATVAGQPGVVPPSGTVTFSVNGNVVVTQALDANRTAVFVSSTLPAGNHSIRAQFNQDANYFSASQTITQVVTLALVRIRVAPASTEARVGDGRQFTAIGTFSDGSEKILPNAGGGGNAPAGGTWQAHFGGTGLNFNDCVASPGSGGGFSSQSFFTDNGQIGNVHTTWSPSTPVVKVDGTVTLGQVNLVLTCASTAAPAGTIIANWTGTRYEGSATLSGVTVPVSIVGWSEKASMPTARFAAGAASANGLVYVMGGVENGAPSSTVAAYDPVTNTWTGRAQMLTSHEGPGVAPLGGRIYVAGGNAPGGAVTSAVERYDPVTDTWESLAPIPTPRAHFALVAAGGFLYAIGGDGGGANPAPMASVERYDPATNTWLARAPLSTPRRFLAAGALNGGTLIVAAGGSAANNAPTASTEIYDVATNAWSAASPMLTADTTITGAVAQNALYVFGGSSNRQLAYMYRVASGQQPAGWAAIARMPAGRGEAAAAAVGDVIYVAGGLAGANGGSATAALEAFHTPPPYDFQVNQGGGGGGGLPNPTWSLSNPAVANIGPSGFVNALAPGQTMVVATASGISCVATNSCGSLTVVSPAHVTFALAPGSVVFPVVTLTVTRPASGETEGPFDLPIGAMQEIDAGLYQLHFTPPAGYTVSPDQVELNILAGDNLTVALLFAPIDVTPPLLMVPPNQSAEATSGAGAVVTFPSATATDDGSGVRSVTCDHVSGEVFPIGSTVVHCTATDKAGNVAAGNFSVTVSDSTAPVIGSVSPGTGMLWPPNHRMVSVGVQVAVQDAVTTAPACSITDVRSNEPANGLGDGDVGPDWLVTGPLTVDLRAERGGKGSGRFYTVEVSCSDQAGNRAVARTVVAVPHDRR